MAGLTKKDLKVVLDRKLEEYQVAILEAINFKFSSIEKDIKDLTISHKKLINTLDSFLKRLTAHEEEFEIVKAELKLIKKILKEKLGVEVSLQGK